MSNISEKAYIAPGAKLGNNVTVYPFAYIEDDTVIGDGCVIYPYASIMSGTRMGRDRRTSTTRTVTRLLSSSVTATSSVRTSSSTAPRCPAARRK